MLKKIIANILASSLLLAIPVYAEETHNHHEDMHKTDSENNFGMSSSTSSDYPMSRDGSGTSWQPDSSPMRIWHFMAGDWSFMAHANLFARYNWQNPFNQDKRGDNKFDAPNWFMLMGQTPILDNDRFTFHTMFSLDPLTVGGSGYPLLFQTGESWQGNPLIDAQHPHDLIDELSVTYSHYLQKNSSLFVYLGFPGEPALGPNAFMHRQSSSSNPDAPIGHHWQDATHITFGVATLGYVYNNFKLDASVFTGREPDENRYNFDMPRFDSYSGRLTYNPSENLSVQSSFGFIKSPESLDPNTDIYKSTASASHNYVFEANMEKFTNLATSLVWGLNFPVNSEHSGHPLHSILLESELQFFRSNFLYTKMEYIQKDNHELVLNLPDDKIYNIFGLTLGASRDIINYNKLVLSAGAQATLYINDNSLEAFYGRLPLAFEVYLRLRPDLFNNQHEHDMHNMKS